MEIWPAVDYCWAELGSSSFYRLSVDAKFFSLLLSLLFSFRLRLWLLVGFPPKNELPLLYALQSGLLAFRSFSLRARRLGRPY